jgi:hypothetical protein
LLFPNTLTQRGDVDPGGRYRSGRARQSDAMNRDIADFTAAVNTYCQATGRIDPIPTDPVQASITGRRLRRTLAWHIARKPRGLVAAAIQYGHLRVQMTLGYAKAQELHQMGDEALVA